MWDRLLANRWFVWALSIALALIIYLQVTGQGNGTLNTTIPNVPVETIGLPSSLWEDSIAPSHVAVTVSGPKATVDGLNLDLVTAAVNLSGAKSGPAEYVVTVSIPSGLTLTSVSPKAVQVVTEPIVAQETPVTVETTGSAAPGYGVKNTAATPSEVVLSGPQSAVDAVASVVATIKLAGADSSVDVQSSLEAVNASAQPVSNVTLTPPTVRVIADIVQTVPDETLPVVVQTTGQPGVGYEVGQPTSQPAVVTVLAPSGVLTGLTSIQTEPLNVAGATKTITETITLLEPTGVQALQPSSVSVTVPIVHVPASSSASSASSALGGAAPP